MRTYVLITVEHPNDIKPGDILGNVEEHVRNEAAENVFGDISQEQVVVREVEPMTTFHGNKEVFRVKSVKVSKTSKLSG